MMESAIEKLNLTDGDIILVRGGGMDAHNAAMAVSQAARDAKRQNVSIVLLPEGVPVSALSDQDLEAAGLIRIDTSKAAFNKFTGKVKQ